MILTLLSHTHTHSVPVRFEVGLDEEVVRFVNEDVSPIVFECEVSGNPLPTLSFLVNSQPLPLDNGRVTVEFGTPSCRYVTIHDMMEGWSLLMLCSCAIYIVLCLSPSLALSPSLSLSPLLPSLSPPPSLPPPLSVCVLQSVCTSCADNITARGS